MDGATGKRVTPTIPDSDSPRDLQTLRPHSDHAAELVDSRRALQPRAPTSRTTGARPKVRGGAVCSRQCGSGSFRGSLDGTALVPTPGGKSLAEPGRRMGATTHPVGLGLEGGPPYSDPGDQFAMTAEQRYRLRRSIPLLPYLEQQGWKATAYSERDEVCGLCPLHDDSRPSSMSIAARMCSTAMDAGRTAM
jgi:hypothetical protein